MSFQEKRNLVYLLNSFIIYGGYGVYVWQLQQVNRLDSTNWGVVILLLIPIHIIINIVMHIVFIILNTLITHEEEPSIVDELDKSIEFRAARNAYYVFMVGFLAAMATVAGDLPSYAMFNMFVLSLFVSELTFISTQLYFYRSGL